MGPNADRRLLQPLTTTHGHDLERPILPATYARDVGPAKLRVHAPELPSSLRCRIRRHRGTFAAVPWVTPRSGKQATCVLREGSHLPEPRAVKRLARTPWVE